MSSQVNIEQVKMDEKNTYFWKHFNYDISLSLIFQIKSTIIGTSYLKGRNRDL